MGASVGQLNANLTLGNAQFNAALEESQARTGKFQNNVGAGTGNFVKFNTHMLESRRTMRLLGEAAGANLSKVTMFAHAFGTFGSIAGAAVVGLMLLQEHFRKTGESADNAKHHLEGYHKWLKGVNDLVADRPKTKFDEKIDEAEKRAAALHKRIEKENASWHMQQNDKGQWEQTGLSTWSGAREAKKLNDLQQREQKLNEDARFLRSQATKEINAQQHAGTSPHILRAVHGDELSTLKDEHSNPMVDLLKKSVALQEQQLAETRKKNGTTETGLYLDH